jgi:glycosyltransferase involved in cell wall biosynthesis
MIKNSVSILITNFNKDRFLEKSIISCIKQKYKEKEIIVFDDCSTDNSKEILRRKKKNKNSL